jgi:hypothetical protein
MNTMSIQFFAMGMDTRKNKNGTLEANARGFVTVEKNGEKHRTPTKIQRKVAAGQAQEITDFLKSFKRFQTYQLDVEVQGDYEFDLERTVNNPNWLNAGTSTEWNEVLIQKPPKLEIWDFFSDKETYGLKMSTVIDNQAFAGQASGVSALNASGFTEEGDVKMLIINPTSDVRVASTGNKFYSATSLYDPDETISLFTHPDDMELGNYTMGADAIIVVGTIQKRPSAYSEYIINPIADQPIDYQRLNILLGKK